MGIAPGTVREFSVEQLAGPDEVSASLHDVGLMETLLMARLLGECPDDIVVFGVQPGNLSWGTSLSPAVLRALPDLTACVLDAVFRRLAVAEPSGD
jgi:hydrogenase maturation protease